jgi:hypothetical protein
MDRYKYPRTPHLPFSPGASNDDKILTSLRHFIGREVVLTTKMDGENTSLYQDGFHARSIDGRHHPSRDWLARFHAGIAHEIPSGWRICGENLFARHSIAYDALPSYFLGFSVWNELNQALSWDETLEVFSLIGVEPVPVLYRGLFDAARLESIARGLDTSLVEGFVVRFAEAFEYEHFGQSVAKWVREKHVQTDVHWMHSSIVPNRLRSS